MALLRSFRKFLLNHRVDTSGLVGELLRQNSFVSVRVFVAVAVSGSCNSIALTHMTKQVYKSRVLAIIVDHG